MTKKYDAALRDRVVGAVNRGMSARGAAARYEVGVATAIRWVRRWRESSWTLMLIGLLPCARRNRS